ncbi:ABC transporter permease [Micromonospora sp. RP3T]|uniref:ABC transporter permease n=1 Tax=Micromonospora sp. RP3T TaxID=2135446 RepID=UPI003D7567D6
MADALRPYRVLLGSRMRAQTAYRRSFAVELVASVGATLIALAEIYVIFSNVDAIGGIDFPAAVLLFALTHMSFSLADMVVGHLGNLPMYVRNGTLDAYLLRPLPVLAQLITSDISLRRLGRTALAVVILVVVIPPNQVAWSAGKVVLMVLTVMSGTVIFAGLFVIGGAIQFWLVEGTEFAAAVTYGGNYAAQYPASIYSSEVRILFTFVVPAAFVSYLPVVVLLDLPSPAGFPSWLGWFTPAAAAAVWGLALTAWRTGLRHYAGTGS